MLSAFIIGMNLSSIAVPLAWVPSPSLVDISPWPSLWRAFEAGLALCSPAAVIVLKLPTSVQIHVFEPLDFLTFALVAPAIALLCAVLVQGVNAWWFDTPWLAWALAASLCCSRWRRCSSIHAPHAADPAALAAARARWPGAGAIVMRFMMAATGAVGLLRMLGMQSGAAAAVCGDLRRHGGQARW